MAVVIATLILRQTDTSGSRPHITLFLDVIDHQTLLINYFPTYMIDLVYHAAELHTRDLLYAKHLMTSIAQPIHSKYVTMISRNKAVPLHHVELVHPCVSQTCNANSIMNTILMSMMPTMFLQSV